MQVSLAAMRKTNTPLPWHEYTYALSKHDGVAIAIHA